MSNFLFSVVRQSYYRMLINKFSDPGDSDGPITRNVKPGRMDRITVEEVMGTINAHTSGGSVKAHISRQPDSDCRLTTSGGSITVYLERDISVNLDASTSGGSVYTDFPVTIRGKINPRKLNAKINGGGPLLYLHTSGGSIHIKEF